MERKMGNHLSCMGDKEIPIGVSFKSLKKYVPEVSYGRVIKVYDGDTITIAAYPYPTSKTLRRFSVRIAGIDTPEKRGSDATEKKIACMAQAYLSALILGRIVTLQDVNLDKYGRLLATVFFDEANIGDLMLSQRFAVKYDGGTKVCPKNWEKYHSCNAIPEE